MAASAQADVGPMLAPVPGTPADGRYWWYDPHYIEAGRRPCYVMA
ncbi:MAG: hypothetical protein ACM3ML_01055 [Micromonosporaceae bacterium]